MGRTPSKRRRKGREAFDPGADPMDFQPYVIGTFAYDFFLPDWLDGWNEAAATYEAELKEIEEGEQDMCDEDYECFMEFKIPLGGRILINVYQILNIIEDCDMKRTEIRVFQNSYIVEGTYDEIRQQLEDFVCQD